MPEIVPDLVSTIIPVFNRPVMLVESVGSVLAQTHRPIEVIIADDGSTDDTARIADQLAAAHAGIVRVLHNPNRGPGPAREAGRCVARGEFIQYLDSDDLLWPRKFEVQVAALRSRPDCGAAYGYIRLIRNGEPPGTTPLKWSGRELPTLFPCLLVDRWWNTLCPLLRRSLCDAVGPWSDLRYSQDWEYDGRIGALGTRLVHCKEFVCDYRKHSGARQTGEGKWLSPPERVRFLSRLFACARQAGVPLDCSEMRHFSRWVFLNARQSGALGDAAAAAACYALAVQAVGAEPPDMRHYRWLAQTIGWVTAGRLAAFVVERTKRRPGRHTQPLSTAHA